jgi:pimeloyl-ACP methyl ester carboxylesterase
MSTTRHVPHHRIRLALHTLRDGSGAHPLLLLHGLGERSPATVPAAADAWPGPVVALDFTGHGASTVPSGGGYTAELLMADVDVVLADLGPATLLGRGLGGYVALLTAGARPDLVRGAVIADGSGLIGGPTGPTSPRIPIALQHHADLAPPDPYALLELSSDVRTADYAVTFARHAAERSGLDQPIAVAATGRPPWLAGVIDSLALEPTTVAQGLALYAG